MRNLLLFLFILTALVSCGNNKETKSLSHCSDIKFISYANKNPHLFIDPSKVIAETKIRDKKIKEWIKINHNPKDLMGVTKLKDKMNDKFDEISHPLYLEIIFFGSKARDVTMLNDKTIDWQMDHKREELKNYDIFYLECVDELLRIERGADGNEAFVKKYHKWQKQDVSNLNAYHHKVFDDLQTFSKDYQFTTKIWELQKKLMQAVQPL